MRKFGPGSDRWSGAGLSELARPRPDWSLAVLFAILLAFQALGFLIFGTGRTGRSLSECILVIDSLVPLVCSWIAFRRARGITALFWFLFGAVVLVLLTPTAIQAYDTVFGTTTLSDSIRGLLYCLYGAPVLMMFFLPEADQREPVKSEIMLDLLQVAIVVSLIYSTFFFLPIQHMMPAAAVVRSITVSDLQSLLLVIAGFVRLQFVRTPDTRDRMLRLTIFLAVCAVITFIGDWIDLHFQSYDAWFDLGWALPIFAAAAVPFTWKPSADLEPKAVPASFLSFLGTNLSLVAMLSGLVLLTDHWKQAYGGTITNVAIAASLLTLALRLSLNQFHQYQEIAYRKSAQNQLAVSNEKIAGLLTSAQRQTAQISEIDEFGTLLQACASREEAFRVIAERLEGLFPELSGSLSILNAAGTRAEKVVEWGTAGQDPGRQPGSTCIPLIAREEALGVMTITQNVPVENPPHLSNADEPKRLRQLASSVAEHIALTISNLDLRAALQAQAIRDPLTGLYNRRYMQDSLARELRRAHRRDRPLSVMMLDIDHFKNHNDTYGHAAGDEVLRLVAEVLSTCIRTEDLACRYGGEEFVLILPECALSQAAIRAEEVRRQLRALYDERPGELPRSVTVSIGVAGFPETTADIDLLLQFADEALYRAKREGRDRVAVARVELTDLHRFPSTAHRAAPAHVSSESPGRSSNGEVSTMMSKP